MNMRQQQLRTIIMRVELATSIGFNISVSVMVVTGIGFVGLSKRTRERVHADARKIFAFQCREAGLTTTEIGDLTGRDHATVIHQLRQYNDLYTSDPRFREMADQVKELVNTPKYKLHHENA